MKKESSIRYLTTKPESPSQSKPFESINLTIGGVTLFVPDTQGFEVDTSKGNLILKFSAVFFNWRHKSNQWAARTEAPNIG